MLLSVSFWTIDRDQWVSTAIAATVTNVNTRVITSVTTMTSANGMVITAVTYTTLTHTSISTNTDAPYTSTKTGTSTDTNCHPGTTLYGGGQWNYCNRKANTNQDNTQEDTKDLNDKGADKSSALGMAAIAAGMAMVAAGMALLSSPPTVPAGMALIAAGMALIAAGMAALAAASKMNNNANKAGGNAIKMDNLTDPYKSTISTDTGKNADGSSKLPEVKKVDLGDGNTSGIKIDPALLRNGKLDGIFGDMEKNTGLNRDELANGLANGGNPLSMLANSPALKGKSIGSEGNLNKMMDDTMSKGNLPGAEDMMNQLGLTEGDLASNGGGSRGPAAPSTPNIDSLFPTSAVEKPSSGNGVSSTLRVSPEVQAALDKNGITGRTIFEMVHNQYVKKTPLMFGVQERKPDGTKDNPYSGLNGGGKLDL